MKITKLKVENFRHIENQIIEFGNNLTVISGQNGTGKSSLLGWVAQAFHFNYKNKTITGKPFYSKYSEIFRFCEKNDYSKKYKVSLIYKDAESNIKEKQMTTRHLKETEGGKERYKVDFDRNIKGREQRALNFPVIYLGLKRLLPLATEKSISFKNIELDRKEKTRFSNLSKKILILLDENISSEGITSTNKDILAMRTQEYGHLGNSAGQDNVGQIISAIISLERFKNMQVNNLQGGLFLIDEVDATLYAGSQIHLIEELCIFSKVNNIQVIFTTHSLEILEHLADRVGEDIKINFLELRSGKITNKVNPSISFLKNKIKVQTGKKDKINKFNVFCEDKETEIWCKNLLKGTSLKEYLNIEAVFLALEA